MLQGIQWHGCWEILQPRLIVHKVNFGWLMLGVLSLKDEKILTQRLPFARKTKEMKRQGLKEGATLVEVVREVKPDVLLGLSVVGGLFSKEVLEAMKGSTSTRPAIFAMSNPTKNCKLVLFVPMETWRQYHFCEWKPIQECGSWYV